jgi:hypothetical protein
MQHGCLQVRGLRGDHVYPAPWRVSTRINLRATLRDIIRRWRKLASEPRFARADAA